MQKWTEESALSKEMSLGVSNQLSPMYVRVCDTYFGEFIARKESQMTQGIVLQG
jgi:hypothetical protein